MKLGDLEREVMEVLWSDPTSQLTVRDVNEHFPNHAYTTIMTVLSRLTAKGFLTETKQGRLNTFRATASREDYITGMIMDALSSTQDRQTVLARFVESLPASDRSFFRKIFARGTR
ncbi:MAG TPA: BlaI/MecI/CopY family transcriptional regulator [Acidimicrobiales bacterium]